jgi:hypothetical protein
MLIYIMRQRWCMRMVEFQDSASGIQYPAGFDQMSSPNKHDVNNDNDPRQLVTQSLDSTPMQYGSQALVDMHGCYAHNIPVHDSSMSMHDGSPDPADGCSRYMRSQPMMDMACWVYPRG